MGGPLRLGNLVQDVGQPAHVLGRAEPPHLIEGRVDVASDALVLVVLLAWSSSSMPMQRLSGRVELAVRVADPGAAACPPGPDGPLRGPHRIGVQPGQGEPEAGDPIDVFQLPGPRLPDLVVEVGETAARPGVGTTHYRPATVRRLAKRTRSSLTVGPVLVARRPPGRRRRRAGALRGRDRLPHDHDQDHEQGKPEHPSAGRAAVVWTHLAGPLRVERVAIFTTCRANVRIALH
jgi:hypothetical protein